MKKLIQFSAITGFLPLSFQRVDNAIASCTKLFIQFVTSSDMYYPFAISANKWSVDNECHAAIPVYANTRDLRGKELALKNNSKPVHKRVCSL
jgi:hypothetical protein